jgi:hypothetical protein
MFTERLIYDDGLTAISAGFRLKLGLPAVRSLPLSCVENIELTIGAEPIARDEITIELDGDDYSLDGLHDLSSRYWFVLDPLDVTVRRSGLVQRGETHELNVVMTLRFPYILIGEDDLLVTAERATKTLTAD